MYSMSNNWSQRCPKGHASLRVVQVEDPMDSKYLCEYCDWFYRGTPIKAADADGFPLPKTEIEAMKLHPRGTAHNEDRPLPACNRASRTKSTWEYKDASVFPPGHPRLCKNCFDSALSESRVAPDFDHREVVEVLVRTDTSQSRSGRIYHRCRDPERGRRAIDDLHEKYYGSDEPDAEVDAD